MRHDVDFVICGAGPVGLYAAAVLAAQGRSCVVLEREAALPTGSRAIGVHPPSLSLFAELGLADAMVQAGLRLQQAQVAVDKRQVAVVDFSKLEHAFPFVLSLPQADLLQLLRTHLPVTDVEIAWQTEVVAVTQDTAGVTVTTADGETVTGAYLLVADGMRSNLRELLGCEWRGRTYPDTYLMGDAVAVDTEPELARIYLGRAGLVESLPMPGGVRRWVVRQETPDADAGWDELRQTVGARTGAAIGRPLGDAFTFRVHGYQAGPLVRGRAFLLGDAAHVVSPIGGQGMNLGWLNAHDLLVDFDPGRGADWERVARRRAGIARRQAYWNMALGRSQRLPWLLQTGMRVALNSPWAGTLRRRFAMTHLA